MYLKIAPPVETQKEFFKAKAKHIGFGGARGGGKSWAVRTKAKLLALKYAGIRILIVRRSFPELINNHINILKSELLGIASYNEKNKALIFKNGSSVNFTYCDHDRDLERLQGVEYDVIFLDEATQLSEFQMKTITACLRGVNDFPKRVYYTCNPGGQGHGYIKRIFIDKKYEEGEDPKDYTFIRSLVTDNKALMKVQPDYIKQLDALPPKLRDAWLYGRWDIFEGQFFEDFVDQPKGYADRRWTHVITPFEIPADWRIYRSFDWGYAKPFSCGWWARDHDGTLYRILELYGCTKTPNEGVKWNPAKVFSTIAQIEGEHRWLKGKHIVGYADPAIWNGQMGKSVADIAAEHGVFFQKGENQRLSGWMQFHYRLSFDENGYPSMYIFSTCKAFIRTIPLLQYDTHSCEDLDSQAEDHVADETRYFLMAQPMKAPKKEQGDSTVKSDALGYLDLDAQSLGMAPVFPRFEIIKEGKDADIQKKEK